MDIPPFGYRPGTAIFPGEVACVASLWNDGSRAFLLGIVGSLKRNCGGEIQMGKSLRLRPLQDRLIVERIEESEKTSSGLYIPDTAKEKPQRGKVMAVGKGKVRDDGTVQPLDLGAGDTILFGKYSGTEVKVDGTEYLIMREDDVLCVVDQ